MYLSSCSGLALSVTFGDRFPFCRLRDIFPGRGKSFLKGRAKNVTVRPYPLPLGATMMTAASGGNRESLLGQWASKTQVLFKHEADAGCRNPGSGTPQA